MNDNRNRDLKIFIVAGEMSGDALGGRLMTALQSISAPKQIEFYGIGGEAMEAAGLKSQFPMSELSIMGLLEIVPHIRQLLRRLDETAKAIEAINPDVIVTIDSPGFTHRLVSRLKSRDIPRIHYVAPSVWAWKPKRVHKYKAHFDHLMALLPFEPKYFEAVGLPCSFVGHSVLESGADEGNGSAFRERHNIPSAARLLCMLPGSRKGEVTRHIAPFKKAVELLIENSGTESGPLHCVIPTVPHLEGLVRDLIGDWHVPTVLFSDTGLKFDAMAASNVALAASGTVSLELALARVPMVIAYRLNPITHFMVDRMVLIRQASLLNYIEVLAGRAPPIPEHLQNDCIPERLSRDLEQLLSTGGVAQIERLSTPLRALSPAGGGKPSETAAQTVLDVIKKAAPN